MYQIKSILTALMFILFFQPVFGQLEIRTINRQSEDLPTSNARVLALGDTISLPFWDDFSFSNINPDTSLWESNRGVLINGSIGNIAPSINVASFDGNDANGSPYSSGDLFYGETDHMISRSINLEEVVVEKRDSVYFSFYWQMQGLGEIPEQDDSLFLDFKNDAGIWKRVWSVIGIEENLHPDFQKQVIQINSETENYFHSGFQFRFSAKGNPSGPFDAWHIDYVYLNQDRSATEEWLRDRAVASLPTSIFKEYTMIPFDVLLNFSDTIYNDIEVDISTFNKGAGTTFFQYTLSDYRYLDSDSVTFDTLYNLSKEGPFFPAPGTNRSTMSIPSLDSSYFDSTQADSIFLQSEFIFETNDSLFISSIDGNDTTYFNDVFYNYRLNDTVRTYFEIHNTLAYDDGIAEYAAGLNKNEGMLAVEFNLPSQDTLTHIDIYFPKVAPIADGRTFNFFILKNLSGNESSVMAVQQFQVMTASNVNEFSRYEFDIPVLLTDKFYVVFQQFGNDYISIGLDNTNRIGTSKIHLNIEEEWEPNLKVEGILMIRPVFKDSDYVVAATKESNVISKYLLYPNPVSGELNIEGDFTNYECFDLSGQLQFKGSSHKISVASLKGGMYLLKIYSNNTFKTLKFVVE
jgi:hypothetical protein